MDNTTSAKTLDIMTVAEAAQFLRLAPATLRSWRHQGRGPQSFNFGGRIFFKTKDLEAWAAAQYAQAVGEDTPQAS